MKKQSEECSTLSPTRVPTNTGFTVIGRWSGGHSGPSGLEDGDGHHPILNEDKSKGMIASGGIYNFQRIRDRLDKGYPFQTHSDSEVILALYSQRGPDGVRDLDGKFVLALFDKTRDIFLLARDPLGVKALYYGYRGATIYFTSERMALSLAEVEEVYEFPPGHYYTPADGFVRYYRLPEVDRRPLLNIESIGLRIRKILPRAVHKRVMTGPQVPVGLLCGGDLASSIVAAIAARQIRELLTCAVDMGDGQGNHADDFVTARLVVAHIGTTHHELIVTENDFHEALHQVIYQLRSCTPSVIRPALYWFIVSKLTADYVSVVLTGQGANELFAGYHYMKHFPLAKVNAECRRCLGDLHHLDLERADALAVYFNLQIRAPFLDNEMISLSMKIPAALKIKKGENGHKISKWIFRQAFAQKGFLSDEILWRGKQRHPQQESFASLADVLANREIDDEEMSRLSIDHPGVNIDSREAALYFKILREVHP
jgi:asparagine synthase (glutamine-hydrolysing)